MKPFFSVMHVFPLFPTIKVNLVAKIMQNAYLFVILHVKHKKKSFLAVLTEYMEDSHSQIFFSDFVSKYLSVTASAEPFLPFNELWNLMIVLSCCLLLRGSSDEEFSPIQLQLSVCHFSFLATRQECGRWARKVF